MRSATARRAAWTLVELVVVVAIIAVLAALLLPALRLVRLEARMMHCAGNQRQVALAMLARCQDNRGQLWRPFMGIRSDLPQRDPIPTQLWAKPVADPGRHPDAVAHQRAEEWNWPEFADYAGMDPADLGRMRAVLYCPQQRGDRGVLNANAFWAVRDVFVISYAYFAHSASWSMWSNVPDRLCDRRPESGRILLADVIMRWTGGGGRWYANHDRFDGAFGVPGRITPINIAYGDGRIVRRTGSDFDPALMESLGSHPERCRWVNASDWWQDRFYF